MMVCVGACLIMMVSAFGFSDILGTPNVTLDPSRIAAQVVSGIRIYWCRNNSVLKQGTVRGLTTASGLWTVAAIGLATGGGMYFAATITTGIAIIILWALKPLEMLYLKKNKQKVLKITTKTENNNHQIVKHFLDHSEIKIQNFSLEKNDDEYVYLLEFENGSMNDIDEIIQSIKSQPGIKIYYLELGN
jgi:putative Mg2+ transporter-C (MgtC) family protein